ncbi:MAG TPA: MFS transporter [Tepidisphaeraceae bacterium]|jgi:MFS family permease|nr:MFS transporter [Tepidisphaeraceae bacterium]
MTDVTQRAGALHMSESGGGTTASQKWMFWACWAAMIATAFCFVVRAQVMDTWALQFNLTKTQMGEIFGVGLWPFAISIILFSLVIDRIGYGTAMAFAFVCHVASALITIFAPKHFSPYWSLYIGNLVAALANGTVEAVVNPVVATIFSKQKTKWLNMLHAGWPGGLVIGGLLAWAMGTMDWRYKIGLLLIPTIAYGIMMLTAKFPISERVAAGVPYREMLKEFGFLGALIVSFLIFAEIGRDFSWSPYLSGALVVVVTVGFGAYVGFAPGRPLFIFMLLIMLPLATTELGTDSWITSLMTPSMEKIGLPGIMVLIYTSFIMMVLRFSAGSIVHRISPLGLLATATVIAAIGLVLLSHANGAIAILAAATVYGLGKTFFWPTMLGVVAEQSPKGGALTLNATGGVGMLGVGVVGAVFLGYIQDSSISKQLHRQDPAAYNSTVSDKKWVFGEYKAVDEDKVKALPTDEQAKITSIGDDAKKGALATVAIFPGIMLACYLILIFYFKSQGGYEAQVLTGHAAVDGEYTGGVPGPAGE